MTSGELHVGDAAIKHRHFHVDGTYVSIAGEDFYKISHYDVMKPFFISLVSHTDLWLFISTTGGLSAGRKNEESAIFPYYTDDKIAESHHTTGNRTVFRIKRNDGIQIWEPFSDRYPGVYTVNRNLYKNVTGNKIIFEEINDDLGLTFQYSWQFSDKYGLVKRSEIRNHSNEVISLAVLDGIQNILPYGIGSNLQNIRSNLANAYKKNELDPDSGLGIFVLSSMIVDKAEPSEALKCTTVWSSGIEAQDTLLSSSQLGPFRQGNNIYSEYDVRAEPGAFFVRTSLDLGDGEDHSWFIVTEVNQDHADVVGLIKGLGDRKKLHADLIEDIDAGTQSLRRLVGMSDGLQLTSDKLSVGRHYANVLFNIMRGGIFDDQYKIDKRDLLDYVNIINTGLLQRTDFFKKIDDQVDYQDLLAQAKSSANSDIVRLCYEYLPLTFSRRHGDPSRPWNRFSIETRREDGTKIKSYEGNWRDIFQNWEALGLSFPGFLQSMISKFVNASTLDGYNPYRITREGVDWEVIEPDDPWSYIGYWGDHQIIYLLKLMELASNHDEKGFSGLLSQSDFVYANVPYRIKSYHEIVANPQDTIDFDGEEELRIEDLVAEKGADGKLVHGKDGELLRANLTEKLLVTLLAKLSNFIPEAGIWLNTQRPEWNDANNALVGNGVSMVTLYYMRRFVSFCSDLFAKNPDSDFQLNKPVLELFDGIYKVFVSNRSLLKASIPDENRRLIVDELGELGQAYRNKAYQKFDSNTDQVASKRLLEFFDLTLEYLDHTIRANKREDGLYHAYNLIEFQGKSARFDHLYEMLEGQVAILSAGLLDLRESLEVLDALKNSKIYREDQYSYMLYPNRDLPRFLDKNFIPKSFIDGSKLAQSLLADKDRSVLVQDQNGNYHFNGNFNNAESLKGALQDLNGSYDDLVKAEFDSFLQVFEEMFNHKAFTGRSGTFFGFEGLGSIYWHMVSKLLLATQENIIWEKDKYAGTEIMGKMIDHYYEIRAGIGINKSPDLYGAFPTDPYSHTPGNKGAQQPGMTGQVKEDIINRWSELGVFVKQGAITFEPSILRKEELLTEGANFHYFGVDDAPESIEVPVNALAFTYCQVPIVYQDSSDVRITVKLKNGEELQIDSNVIPSDISREIFNRTTKVQSIMCRLPIN